MLAYGEGATRSGASGTLQRTLQARAFAIRTFGAGLFPISMAVSGNAQTQSPPPPTGFSLELSAGPGWDSNPLELNRRTKGDVSLGFEANAAYRWALWKDAAFTVSGIGTSTLFLHETAGGLNRLSGVAALSQRWQGFSFSLTATARSATNQRLTQHDSASQDIAFGLSRPVVLAMDWSLIPSGGIARRFHQDGSEDQVRARLGLALVHKRDKWTYRLNGGYAWALEDKTPILPRINDRVGSIGLSATYEWIKDREASIQLGYSRTFSSYEPNRRRGWTLAPKVGTTLRF
jgi:hypothetical protein